MLKGDASLCDVVVAHDAVFFAVVVCAGGKDSPGVSLKPSSAVVTGAAEVSHAGGVRVVRFDAEAERGAAAYDVDVTATVDGKAQKLMGPHVPARHA